MSRCTHAVGQRLYATKSGILHSTLQNAAGILSDHVNIHATNTDSQLRGSQSEAFGLNCACVQFGNNGVITLCAMRAHSASAVAVAIIRSIHPTRF